MAKTNGADPAANGLTERLNEPQVVNALNRLLDRIDSLEKTVADMEMAVQQFPGAVAMATDTVDEVMRNASQNGIDVDARFKDALNMVMKLTEPKTMTALSAVVENLETLPNMTAMVTDIADATMRDAAQSGVDIDERLQNGLALLTKLTENQNMNSLSMLVDKLDTLAPVLEHLETLPGMLGMVADIFDEMNRNSAESGVDLDTRLKSGLNMLTQLTDPKVSKSMSLMLGQLDGLLPLMEHAQTMPEMVGMLVDILDEMHRNATASGLDLESLLTKGAHVTNKVSGLLSSKEFDALMESGILDPQSVSVVAKAANALAESKNMPAQRVSMMGLLRAMKDPQMQTALGFLVNFGKKFGSNINA